MRARYSQLVRPMIRTMTTTLPLKSRPRMVTLGILPPKNLAITMSRKICGMMSIASVKRINTLSSSAAVIARGRANQDAHEHLQRSGRHADQQRDLAAIDGAGQDIAPDRVGAEGMLAGGRLPGAATCR